MSARVTRIASVIGLFLLAACSRRAPALRDSPPVPPDRPGAWAWVVRPTFLRVPGLEHLPPALGWGDRVQVLVVLGEEAYVEHGRYRGRMERSALVDAEGVVAATWWCRGEPPPEGGRVHGVIEPDVPACWNLLLAYARDGDRLKVLASPGAGGVEEVPAGEARFDEAALATARTRALLDVRRELQELMGRRVMEAMQAGAKAAPATPEAAGEVATAETAAAEEGAVAPAREPALIDAAEPGATASQGECSSGPPEEAAPPPRTSRAGPAGIVVFDTYDRSPPPGYDWRALAVKYLSRLQPAAPLPPTLRATAARLHREEAGREYDTGTELPFGLPARDVKGVYYVLGPDGVRQLPPDALHGVVRVHVDDRGCEDQGRSYEGAIGPDLPLVWAPAPVTWKNDRAVASGAGGVRIEDGRLVLERKGLPSAVSEPLEVGWSLEGLQWARLVTLEPEGAQILAVGIEDGSTYVHEVRGNALVLLRALVRGDP